LEDSIFLRISQAQGCSTDMRSMHGSFRAPKYGALFAEDCVILIARGAKPFACGRTNRARHVPHRQAGEPWNKGLQKQKRPQSGR
jgi:hypothetical protein